MSKQKVKIDFRAWIQGEKSSVGIFLMDIAIVILCVVFVFSAFVMIGQFVLNQDSGYKETGFYYRLAEGDYSTLVEMTSANRAEGMNDSGNLQEYYAVADYFEAELFYNTYLETGDEVRAEQCRKKKEDAAERMGSLSAEKQKIDELLSVE